MSSPAPGPSDQALRLLEVFHTYERSFARWTQSLIETESPSPARMRLLGVLNCGGPTIMCGLRDELGVSARQVTNLVDALEAEGLVKRTPHASDRRATVVEITAKGAALACASWGPMQAKMAAPFGELSADDQRELLRLMELLSDAVRRREQGDRQTGGH
ncbi:MAG: MarR family winged helix-turn-helix transcriptional regulator [Isosphaeraceae bacterium]|nr:MarR family winged helix-turn-helix transcriptional regulator [Isosphaeraceae bacterium]